MIIKKLHVKSFGRIHDRTLSFSPGLNVLYGENESGKTTTHTFVKSMFYGIQRQRGRAAKKDAYTLYLPWEDPASYGGTLWFENGGKNYRLTRNFYKENPSLRLLDEEASEEADVEQEALEAVLGGISETVYENTVSVAQLKSTTGADLVHEVQNYMASYQGAGDSSVDLGRTMQLLKMNRKGWQVQADRCRKENLKEQEKLAAKVDYLHKEVDDQVMKIADQEAALRKEDNGGVSALEERITVLEAKKRNMVLLMAATFIAALAGGTALGIAFSQILFGVLAGIAGAVGIVIEYILRMRAVEEAEQRKRQKARLESRQEKRNWSLDALYEAKKERETALENAEAEYQEAEEHAYLPLAEELEIESLNLAMTTIQQLSRGIHRQVGGQLRERTSQILSEITGGRYRSVLMDPELHMSVNTGDRTIPMEQLSRGTVEQVYFALRMAAGELLCGDAQLPVILDEVFGMYDEERLTAVLTWLASQNRQVILLTCRQREMEILDKNGITYQKEVL